MSEQNDTVQNDAPVQEAVENKVERKPAIQPDEEGSKLLQKLRSLWKGTLYTTIYVFYTALIGWLLLYIDWRAALLAFFAITVTHPLRYIVNSVDKIGWEMSNKPDPMGVKAYQQRLFWGLYGIITVCNVFLVGQAYYVGDLWPAVATGVLLAIVEFLFKEIQKLNRLIEFTWADYGRS